MKRKVSELLLHCENDDYIPINKVGIADFAKENVVIKKIADKGVLELISRENKYVNLLRCNDDGFYTYEQSYKPDSSIIWFEDSVCKYNYDGELIGYAIYDTDECVTFPNRPVNVDTDGNIYVMLCKKEQVVIYKVILGSDDISHLEEKLKEREMEYQEEVQHIQSEVASTASTAPAYTRYQAFLRAISMTRLTWTVTSANKNTSLASGKVILPDYVANATVGSTVSGIPYCWGGFNGYESIGNNQKYSEACKGNAVAGNMCTETKVCVVGTVGLDCSGFASSVYGFAEKQGSGYFTTYGTLIDKSEMRYMDILVRSGHVMIYGGEFEYELSNGSTEIRWTVYDASTDTERTMERVVTQSYCREYVARNPWND